MPFCLQTVANDFLDPAGTFSQGQWARQLLESLQVGWAGGVAVVYTAWLLRALTTGVHPLGLLPSLENASVCALIVQAAGGVLRTEQEAYTALRDMIATLGDR